MTLVELKVAGPTSGGSCVARALDGRVVFVRHALPGERVLAQVTSEHSRYLRADAVGIPDRSPSRVDPPCAHAGPGHCGGCDWQHADPKTQRQLKGSVVGEQLRRIAGIDRQIVVEEIPGHASGLGWRTKVRFAVDRDGTIGLHRERSGEVEPVARCLLVDPAIDTSEVLGKVWRGARSVEMRLDPEGGPVRVRVEAADVRGCYVPDLGPGYRVSVRSAHGGRSPSADEACIFQVDGRRYRVSPGVFWQVHTAAASTLVGLVIAQAEPRAGDSIADLYAGAGLFTVPLAELVGPEGQVFAVERSRRACDDAKANTSGLEQVRVVQSPVDPKVINRRIGPVDIVVLDPARSGAGVATMRAVASASRRRIVYVSCDAATFARDAGVLFEEGWVLVDLRVLDLFPMTEHVELVGRFERSAGTSFGG